MGFDRMERQGPKIGKWWCVGLLLPAYFERVADIAEEVAVYEWQIISA